jgi:hypothetical protein
MGVLRRAALFPSSSRKTPPLLVLRVRSRPGKQDIYRFGHVTDRGSPAPEVGGVDQLGRSVELMAL